MSKSPAPRKRQRVRADEPARSRRTRAVADFIPAAGGAAFRRFGFIQSSIVSRWREIVGPRYAAVSVPESIRFPPGKRNHGVLTLTVAGAHAPLMQHVAPAIAERVNRFFGYAAVERVSFRQGFVAAAPTPAYRGEPAAVPAELGESLREVVDPELRACLESLARGLAASEGAATAAIPVVGRINGGKK
ncbi:MAG: DUF721 domain-containing protein [Sphingosinicella sp.]